MPTSDFGQKLGVVLKAINLSRSRLAQTVGVDKSVVSRWASGVQAPTDHNLSLLTEAINRHVPGFARVDWELASEAFAARLGLGGSSSMGGAALALPDRPSIAVLPFENMSGDPEQAYFADGLAEELITGLSRVSWLFVIARNSSFALRGEKLDARSIGQRLGVRYLVEGSVRRAGQRLRLTVQLIEAATGNHLWADRYDGSLEDVFDFQDRTVASLVGAIEPKLRATEIARAVRKRPDSLDAFDLFLRALPKVVEMSVQSLAEAIELLDRAIALSPGYAQALAYTAHCRAVRPMLAYSHDADRDFREADELSRLALDSDPADPMALSVAAMTLVVSRRDYEAGGELINRSLALNPNDATSWSYRGWISAWAGEIETAMTAFEKALRMSPLDPQWGGAKFGMASVLCWAGKPEEALPWVRRALQARPHYSGIHRLLIAVLWLSGRHAEARESAQRYVEMLPGFSLRHARKVSPIRGTPGQEQYYDALRAAGLPE
jgi:adenylate cyclase